MRGKVVLVTGGTGTFGKAFVKDALTKEPKQIRVFSRDELKQAQMATELNDPRVEYLIGDIRDYDRLLTAMEGADIVVHAAALKRIEKCERDPQEAVKTNVQGTINVANACLRNNVSSAVLISTDKACSPINLYGATKLVAERTWIGSNVYRGTNHPTKFSVVRYGNVLGSRGSVIHSFRAQAETGVLQVTDYRMTRFFITVQEAVDLVQLAIEIQQGGEILIPRLKAASILHLAQLMAGKARVEITTQRGSEKLHEVLATPQEFERMVHERGYSVIHPENPTWPYETYDGRYGSPKTFVDSSTAEQYEDNELIEFIRAVA
jgi:UDP-N-acetylglucosamine 4,6-dehydratase